MGLSEWSNSPWALARRSAALSRMWSITVVLLFTVTVRGQLISTVAGTGKGGYNGDEIDATSAQLHWPWHLALDSVGNVYVADDLNSRIRKISTNGVISTIAGTGRADYNGDGMPATAADLNYPRGVAVDASGAVYIADTSNCRVRKVLSNGTITTIAGTSVCGYRGDGSRADVALLSGPKAVAFIGGDMLIADTNNNCIRRVAADGIISTLAGNGSNGYNGDGIPATLALLNVPQGLCTANNGNLYISDSNNNRVRMVFPNGTIVTVAGTGVAGYNGDNIAATTANLNDPTGIAVDHYGNLFFSDFFNSRVRMIASGSGIISTVAGTGTDGYNGDDIPATSALLYNPEGLAIDASGNIYISDYNNERIRMVAGIVPSQTSTSSYSSSASISGTAVATSSQSPASQFSISPLAGAAIGGGCTAVVFLAGTAIIVLRRRAARHQLNRGGRNWIEIPEQEMRQFTTDDLGVSGGKNAQAVHAGAAAPEGDSVVDGAAATLSASLLKHDGMVDVSERRFTV